MSKAEFFITHSLNWIFVHHIFWVPDHFAPLALILSFQPIFIHPLSLELSWVWDMAWAWWGLLNFQWWHEVLIGHSAVAWWVRAMSKVWLFAITECRLWHLDWPSKIWWLLSPWFMLDLKFALWCSTEDLIASIPINVREIPLTLFKKCYLPFMEFSTQFK